jgi:hypothetical protein
VRGIGAALLVLLAIASGCASESDPLADRAARIEARLLASCSCHPKKIEGLTVEREIRTQIRTLIGQGLDDDEILWATLMAHGTELLEAGIEDATLRATVAMAETGAILLVACGVLLLQLRRRDPESG